MNPIGAFGLGGLTACMLALILTGVIRLIDDHHDRKGKH
ncbi:hypothetical protein B1526_1284 [Bifidobacterium criceti]|uniref:Uncharacterized protein n=1 Tax=Bifidobacterium criceti TaxID=1960969 RepID=A0A2A2EDY2_9BIFI|nr:hypothetical protein B1526_1284 [Bifidobacterium criceti]